MMEREWKRADWCGICAHHGIRTQAVEGCGTWHCQDYGASHPCCTVEHGRWGLCAECASELDAGQPDRPTLAELDMVRVHP